MNSRPTQKQLRAIDHVFGIRMLGNLIQISDPAADWKPGRLPMFDTAMGIVNPAMAPMTYREAYRLLYQWACEHHRNEYVYQNALYRHLVASQDDPTEWVMFRQWPVNNANCVSDLMLFHDGHGEIIEIKSDVDTFARLPNQLDSYYTTFSHVSLTIPENKYDYTVEWLDRNTPYKDYVGIIAIDKHGGISTRTGRPSRCYMGRLNGKGLFWLLRKKEYETLVMKHCGFDPASVFLCREEYANCKSMLSNLPLDVLQPEIMNMMEQRQTKNRRQPIPAPIGLQSTLYFAKKPIGIQALDRMLDSEYTPVEQWPRITPKRRTL